MSSSDPPSVDKLKLEDDYQTYKLGDFQLQSGETIPDAFIAYKTLGDPSLPAIIYPTWYSGLISDNIWLTGPQKTLNPSKFYIIIPALFGNSQSSSPSNTPDLHPFPAITFHDNVAAQHHLVTQHLGIKHARAVLGWSMGAGQTYQWATQYPSFMDLIVPFCGAAKTAEHNQVMLEGVKSALYAAIGTSSAGIAKPISLPPRAFHASSAMMRSPRETGLKALARVYAGWGFSQAFYREKVYSTAPTLGFKDLDDFMVNFWEAWALSKDPSDMLCMLQTWQAGDCSAQPPYNGDFRAAMQAIKAKALVLPAQTDLYFPPEDSHIEVRNMREGVGEVKVFPSIWGHWAGGPGQSTEDLAWLDARLKEFFDANRVI